MTGLRDWLARLSALLRRDCLEQELDDEMRTHLEMLAEDLERRGFSPADARAAARREFGGIERTRQAVRDRRRFPLADAVARDLRLTLRQLRASPGFTATVVLTLALGIGANTAIFSLVSGVMLRPLPYSQPDRLFALHETVPVSGALGQLAASGGDAAADAVQTIAVAPANFADYDRSLGGSAALAYYMSTGRTLTGAGSPERLAGEEVSRSYLDVLGVPPALGRDLQPEDYAAGSEPVVIVTDALWRGRLGGATNALGTLLVLDDVPHRLIGVLPPGVVPVSTLGSTDPASFLTPAIIPPDMASGRGEHIVTAFGRLGPGRSLEVVQGALAAVARGIGESDPRTGDLGVRLEPLGADLVGNARPLLLILVAGVALVLLAACANVASLLVVRSMGRRREVAVRVALGASRLRVLLGLAVESAVLAALGGVVGLLLGGWLIGVLTSQAPASLPRLDAVALDARTLAFTALVATMTAALFGILPAWQVRRARPIDVLQDTARSTTGAWARRSRSALLLAEVALSMILVIGAGLMVRSVLRLNAVDLGFDPHHVVAANISLPTGRYASPERRLDFFEAVAARVAAVPGVEAVAFGNRLPLRGNWSSGFELEGRAADEVAGGPTAAGFQAVSAEYFDTFRIPVVSGRALAEADREGAPPVAVVSEAFVRQFLAGVPPLGQRLRRFEGAPWVEIVGVVRDLRRGGRMAAIEPQVYLAAAQTSLYPLRLAELAVRVTGPDVAIAPAIRAAVWAVDADQPLTNVHSLDETLAIRQADVNFQALLFVLFALVTLALAMVGVYGVVTSAIAQRSREIGLRIALGASASRVVVATTAQALAPAGAGAAMGAALAWLLSRYVETRLFGVTPTDPVTYGIAALALAAVAVAASLAAARRVTALDPAQVLRG